ncbi:hypothetical protein HDU79_010466 [Rhizoclosmatium sp. JEL0117]|nr:hypothetical protein HDU79_010466 [Rhizoclosmatium sp. JEL0117]
MVMHLLELEKTETGYREMITASNHVSAQTLNAVKKHLKSLTITEEDPGILFAWNQTACLAFVASANNALANGALRPPFLSPGLVSLASLQSDIVQSCAQVGGGAFGSVLVAPNTTEQAMAVASRLTAIEADVFMQGMCAAALPVGSYLGTIYTILDKRVVTANPMTHAPVFVGRLLFQ